MKCITKFCRNTTSGIKGVITPEGFLCDDCWIKECRKEQEQWIKEHELRTDRLNKQRDALVRYEKKLSYYNKLYSTKIKKTKRSILVLEKYSAQVS